MFTRIYCVPQLLCLTSHPFGSPFILVIAVTTTSHRCNPIASGLSCPTYLSLSVLQLFHYCCEESLEKPLALEGLQTWKFKKVNTPWGKLWQAEGGNWRINAFLFHPLGKQCRESFHLAVWSFTCPKWWHHCVGCFLFRVSLFLVPHSLNKTLQFPK